MVADGEIRVTGVDLQRERDSAGALQLVCFLTEEEGGEHKDWQGVF